MTTKDNPKSKSKKAKTTNPLASMSVSDLKKELQKVGNDYEKELSRGKLAQESPRYYRTELAQLQTELRSRMTRDGELNLNNN